MRIHEKTRGDSVLKQDTCHVHVKRGNDDDSNETRSPFPRLLRGCFGRVIAAKISVSRITEAFRRKST